MLMFSCFQAKPSKDSETLSHCTNYQDMGCCSAGMVNNIKNWKSPEVVSFPYDECGDLSPECENYLLVSTCSLEGHSSDLQ